jgi:hypothetical protein
MANKFDRDERFKIDMDPEDAITEILEGAGASDEDREMEPEEPEGEA